MDFDKILHELGSNGKAQFFSGLVYWIACVLGSITTYVPIFMEGNGNYRCLVPNCENSTSNTYDSAWLSSAIPYVFDEKADKVILDKCHTFRVLSNFSDNTCSPDAFDNTSTVKCTDFVFESTHRTLIKEWNLTCDRSILLTISISVYMLGLLFGVYIFGYLSDKFGRRKVVLLCMVLNIGAQIGLIFLTNYYMYVVLRFLVGSTLIGLSTTSYVQFSEITTLENRHLINLAGLGWPLGEFGIVVMAYFLKDWQHLQITLASMSITLLLTYWIYLESPRWLISQKRYEEAKVVIKRLAQLQGKTICDSLLKVKEDKEEVKPEKQENLNPLYLFKYPKIRKRMMLISIIWIFDSLIGYGISLGSKNIPGNFLRNFALLALADFTSQSISIYFIKRLRRMVIICVGMLLVGITLLSNLAVPSDNAIAIAGLAMCGRFLMTINFGTTYLYTAELFPTPLRSSAMGTGSMFSRVGGILAPFVADLIHVWHPLPILIMGSGALFAAFILLFLPETYGKPLPETIEEIESAKPKDNVFKILNKKFKRKDVSAVIGLNISSIKN